MTCVLQTLEDIANLLRKTAQKNGISEQFENTWQHSQVVWQFSKWLANQLIENGHPIDIDFLEKACFVHDLGRAVTGSKGSKELQVPIFHGVRGGKILRELGCPKLARVCETHIGGGITKEEAKKLGLREQDYLPESIEEKIVCYADARVFFDPVTEKDIIKPFQAAYDRFSVYGKSSERLLILEQELESIIRKKIP
ncbi:MAG: HD domain-containing protein [Promethearchaeota archaeon]